MATSRLSVVLLGRLSVSWDGQPITPPTRKAAAILAWLAASPRATSREALATLLWGEGRLRNVRQELYRLRKLPGAAEWLVEDGSEISLRSVSADISSPPPDWDGALLEGLAGLTPRFEAFREELHLRTLERWLPEQMARAESALAGGQPAQAAALLDQALALVPEDADLLILREAVAAASGDRAAALRARAGGPRPITLHADRLRRLLAVTAAGHPDWPGPVPAPALPPEALAAAIGGDTLLLADAFAELQGAQIIGADGQLCARPDTPGAEAPLLHRRLAERDGAPHAVTAWHLEQAGAPEDAARGYLRDGAPWAAARAASLAPPGPLRARALAVQLDDARRRGDVDEEAALLARLESLATDTQSLEVFSERDQQHARRQLSRGDTRAAIRLAAAAVRHAQLGGTPVSEARARLVRAAAQIRSGQIEYACAELQAASGSGDDAVELAVLNALGAAHAIHGDLEAARTVHEQALLIARRCGDLRACVRLLNNLAVTAERRAAYADSAAAFADVAVLGARIGEANIEHIAALNRAQIAMLRGRLGDVRALLRASSDRPRSPREAVWADRLRAQLDLACGRTAEAWDRLARAQQSYLSLGDQLQAANCDFSIAVARGAPLMPALNALAVHSPPFLLSTARMEALLLVSDPDDIEILIPQIEATRTDPHAAQVVAAGRFRRAQLRGEPAPPPPRPTQELLETPQLLGLRAHAAADPAERAALCDEARTIAVQQSVGLLSAQREARLRKVESYLP